MVFPRQHVAVQVAFRGLRAVTSDIPTPLFPVQALHLPNFKFTNISNISISNSTLLLRPLCSQHRSTSCSVASRKMPGGRKTITLFTLRCCQVRPGLWHVMQAPHAWCCCCTSPLLQLPFWQQALQTFQPSNHRIIMHQISHSAA